jgi:hypothetical protein
MDLNFLPIVHPEIFGQFNHQAPQLECLGGVGGMGR